MTGVIACGARPAGKPAAGLIAEADRIGVTLIVAGNKRMKGMSRLLGAVAKSHWK